MGLRNRFKKLFKSKKNNESLNANPVADDREDFFISYSYDDKIAHRLCHKLEENGFECWIAPRNIVVASIHIDEDIDNAVRNAKNYFLVLSDDSKNSQRVLYELNLAKDCQKTIFVLDVGIDYLDSEFKKLLEDAFWLHSSYFDNWLFDSMIGEIRQISSNQDMPFKKSKSKRNFKYLDDLIKKGSDEIVLDSDIILDDGEEFEYPLGIILDKNITIDGNGHTIDARQKTKIFNVFNVDCITLKNMTLKNGYARGIGYGINSYPTRGGAISIYDGDFRIHNVSFIANMALGGGGAIYNKSSWLSLSESSFSDNLAKGCGGVIFNESNEFIISETEFSGNAANKDGGVIYNYRGKLNLLKVVFSHNWANNNGGALFNHNGELNISESEFRNNSAEKYGGVLYNNNEMSMSVCTITKNIINENGEIIFNNSASKDFIIRDSTISDNIAKNGAIIKNESGNAKIFNCELLENSASTCIILNNDYLEIHNTNFNINYSKNIIVNARSAVLGFFNSKLQDNNVGESVMFNMGKSCSMTKTLFRGNLLNDENVININNQSDLMLINPQIKDNHKSILNNGYIRIKDAIRDFENKIDNKNIVETVGEIDQTQKSDFTYLDEKIHQSNKKEIILNKDICLENYETDFYEGGIELDIDDLIIDGNGKSIDGANKSRIFLITGKNITLKNIVFKNAYSHKNYNSPLNNDGGALKINCCNDLMIENCKFIDNTSEGCGGAIMQNHGDLTISNSSFINNRAYCDGGVICKSGGCLTISKSVLNGNVADRHGGAIFGKGILNIITTTINENSASGQGGAISGFGGTIIESEFSENKSGKIGGAIVNDNDLSVSDSTFNKNVSKMNGGAVYGNYCDSLTISKSSFNENVADLNGGAVYGNYCDSLTISKSSFNENVAVNGGAVYNEKDDLTILKSLFNQNSAEKSGGAIYGHKFSIADSSLIENNAKGDGGAIYTNKGNLTKCKIIGNCADYGGAIYIKNSLTISWSVINENSSKRIGGAIYGFYGSSLTISLSSFCKNTAGETGGAIRGHDLTVDECSLIKNSSQSSGGAISNKTKAIIRKCYFDENTAKNSGDVIYNEGYILFDDLTIKKSSAKSIFNSKNISLTDEYDDLIDKIENSKEGRVTICDSLKSNQRSLTYLNNLIRSGAKEIILKYDISFDFNEDKKFIFGEGINIEEDMVIDGNGHVIDAKFLTRIFIVNSSEFTLKNIELKNGFSMEDGGAIYGKFGSSISILRSSFNQNTSKQMGGAIYGDNLCVFNSSFNNNNANWGGGAIRGFSLRISRALFNKNNAEEGGAIQGGGSISESEFSENAADRHGGAIYNESEYNDLKILKSSFDKNTVECYGGAISNKKCNLTISNSLFTKNTSKMYGGAISNKGDNLNINKSTLNTNTANRAGGAIYNGMGNLTISNSLFTENTSKQRGGAIFNNGENSNIIECRLNANASGRDGGAIYNSGSDLTITESAFNENNSQSSAGAICNKTNLTITKSSLSNNTSDYGGAIENKDKLTIIQSNFKGNTAKGGGAIYNYEKEKTILKKCKFKGNVPSDIYVHKR